MTLADYHVHIYDLTALVVFLIVSVGYHKYYLFLSSRYPRKTMKGRLSFYRRNWIARILKDQNEILAVQSLRNLSMVTVFLASTSLIFLGTALNFFYDIEKGGPVIGMANTLQGTEGFTYHLKVLLLLLTISVAFFNFLKSLRELNYLTILMNTSGAVIKRMEGMEAEDFLVNLLNGAVIRYTLGVRCYYYALVILLWFFSTSIFLAGSILMTLSLIIYNDFKVYKV
jgi:uncharacterized membrane protein